MAAGWSACVQAAPIGSNGTCPLVARIPLEALGNRDVPTATGVLPQFGGDRIKPDIRIEAGPWLLELSGIPRARLDELSQALAAKPLCGDAFVQLIEGKFHNTVLAQPMAGILVANAMPHLLDPGDANYEAWGEVLASALVLPPDPWETQCMVLLPKLSLEAANKVPLFTWLRDALNRHADAAGRSSSPGVANRPSASSPCNPQITDPTATMLLAVGRDARLVPKNDTLSHVLANSPHLPRQPGDIRYMGANIRFAAEYPAAGWTPSLVQSMLNGIRSVADWICPIWDKRPWQSTASKRPATDPPNRKAWTFDIFPGAGAAVVSPLRTAGSIGGFLHNSRSAVRADPVTSASSSSHATTSTTAQTTILDTRGDLRILHDALREHQRLLRRPDQSPTNIHTGQIFVPVGTRSPVAEFATRISSVLTHLKLSIASDGDLPDIYESMNIFQRFGLFRDDLVIKKLDLKKTFTAALSFDSSAAPNFQFNGTSTHGKPASVKIVGARPQILLAKYVERIRQILEASSGRRAGLKGPVDATLRKLAIRDDGQVTLQSLARFYGVILPAEAGLVDLEAAIEDLRPKAALIAGSGDQKLPVMATSFSIDTINLSAPIIVESDEHETSDYGVIAREIKRACSQARAERVAQLTQSHGDSAGDLLLSGLKNSGGIALKMKLDDTDGEDDTYVEQHSVNPLRAETVEEYFDQSADLLGRYMVEKIRDGDGEDEGSINISWIELRLYVPHFVAHDRVITSDDVKIFNMRSTTPPFLYLDAGCMSPEANQVVSKAMGEITAELRISNGDVSKSPTLLAAVNRKLELEDISSLESSEEEASNRVSGIIHDVLEAYYRISSQDITKQQRLLLAQQPTEEEFLSRAVCRQLGIDEFNWPIILGHRIPLWYETGLENRGSFIRGEDSASRTMLELVYDENLRKEIGLASNKEDVCAAAAESIVAACLTSCDEQTVNINIGAFFNGFSLFGLFSGVTNDPLLTELNQAGTAFAQLNDQYAKNATGTYRKLEAERMVLTSASVLTRLDQARTMAKKSAQPSSPIDFQGLLTDEERTTLKDRTDKFRDFLSVRRNVDRFQDLKPGWEQAMTQLKDITLEICRNAPLKVCMGVNLIDDIAEGADIKTIALDGLFYLSSAMSGLKNIPSQRLSALMHVGSNAWTLEQSVEAYRRAVKNRDYDNASKSLMGILMSGHSLLSSGAALVERGYDAISGNSLQSAPSDPGDEALDPGELSPVPVGTQTADRYWSVGEKGIFSRGSVGREVLSPLQNGDLLVEGGARAISLNNGGSTVYMLGDTPCQAIRTASGALELWPVRDLALAENAWVGTTSESGVSYSRPGLPAFPQEFSGPAGGEFTASHDAVAWFGNRVSVFEPLEAQHQDVEGEPADSSTVNIGVLDHKYVIDQGGIVEILEHIGARDGKTQFIRNDGTTLTVERTIPAWPQYKSEIKATVIGSSGMFVAVEVAKAIDGLNDKRRVSGVVAAKKGGGHELVVEIDAGVYYRGDVPVGTSLPLSRGSSDSSLESFELGMRRISPAADPKRASPSVWRARGAYRDSMVAHDDFALELYDGSRLANIAYSTNLRWVLEQHELIQSARLALPPEVRDIEHPYYELATSEADAILFAPRNRAVLANTLVAKTVEWGALSSLADLDFVEDFFRSVQVNDAGDGAEAIVTRSALLGSNERIPVDANERDKMYAKLKEQVCNRNLVLAEVETKEGQKVQFVDVHATDASEVAVARSEFNAADHGRSSSLDMTIKPGKKKMHGVSGGSVVRQIEAVYPNPVDIRSITIFSLDTVSHRLAGDIFMSSASGYTYRSVLRLRQQDELPGSPSRKAHADTGMIRPSDVNLGLATLVTEGSEKDAYQWGDDYYIRLGSDGVYRAQWDPSSVGFRLLPEGSRPTQILQDLPLARKVKGKFRLANPPMGITGKVGLSPAERQRMKQELEKSPTPAVLRTVKQHGEDIILVANPDLVSEKPKLDGRWVLTVNDIEYSPAFTEAGDLAYVRDHPEEAMEMVCGQRFGRGTEPLCVGHASRYIQSRNAVRDRDLPIEGTDIPDAEDWTPWTSDTRVYGATLLGQASRPAWARNLRLVPYEGKYCKLIASATPGPPRPLSARDSRDLHLAPQVTYKNDVSARLMYRQGHGARVRINDFEINLEGSIEVGASIFRMKGSDTEWIVALYDGTWYKGSFDRASGGRTPTTIPMTKMRPEASLSPEETEIQRLHAGMQTANYHAKTAGTRELKEIMGRNRHLGLSPATFDAGVYFESSTTGDQAFLFDRFTRENVQVRARLDAKWSWLKLDDENPEVARSKEDILEIAKKIFVDQPIHSIDDLVDMSKDRNIPMGAKNFLIVRENGGDIYFSISGRPQDRMTPPLFRRGHKQEISVRGQKVGITYIDNDPDLIRYMRDLDRNGEYPRALPTAATPDQMSEYPSVFDVTGSRWWDTERKFIAYSTRGGQRTRTRTDSIEVLNRNDACKSCASLLQQYFKPFGAVIHFYVRDYEKY